MIRFLRFFSTSKQQLKRDKFMALVKPPLGITKDITPEQKTKVDEILQRQMNRQVKRCRSFRILVYPDKKFYYPNRRYYFQYLKKGLPLKIDPFFQFLKNNIKAREIYLKSNQRFTVENVIDIALRQDIGADPSYSRIRSADTVDTKGRADLLHELRDLREGKFNPVSYDGPTKFSVQGAYDELKPHQPLRHYFKPLDRYEKRQQNLRQIKKYDIHWRNVELLRQFVTINGNIKSRYRSFLRDRDQRAVRMAIKTARIMGAMPYFGRTPQPLKKNITSLEDEVQEIGYQHINLESGHLFQTRSRSMDSLQVQVESENDLDYKYKRMTNEGKNFKVWVNNLDKVPQQEELRAQRYARHLKLKEYEQSSKTKAALKQNINNVLKGISKYKVLSGESETKVPPSNNKQFREQFEKEKIEVLEKLQKNPLSILSKLMADKLKI